MMWTWGSPLHTAQAVDASGAMVTSEGEHSSGTRVTTPAPGRRAIDLSLKSDAAIRPSLATATELGVSPTDTSS